MHLGNGAITPECAALTQTAAMAGLGWACWRLRRANIEPHRLLAAGALGAAVFAAQMINVPILPGISAHLIGGVLLAWTLGPSLGVLTMAVVLAVQALCLGDGGLLALGANVINMALAPALLVSVAQKRLRDSAQVSARIATAFFVAALAVPVAAALLVAEVVVFRGTTQLGAAASFAGQMLATHMWIGIAEGLVTAGLLVVLERQSIARKLRIAPRQSLFAVLAAVALIVVALPLASGSPDAYEAAADQAGMTALLSQDATLLAAVGQANVTVSLLQQRLVETFESALPQPQILALLATIASGIVVCGLYRLVTLRRVAPAWERAAK